MMKVDNLKGAMTALVTPFDGGGIDRKALEALVDFQIEGGVSCLVPCGTTGESATLSSEEHEEVIDIVIQRAAGKVPVIAGTGSNNTREAVRFTRHAEEAGADAALIITPYYNKPTPGGLKAHFRQIAEASRLPLVLYNIASRTGINMSAELIAELADIPTVIGVKEASGDLEQVSRIHALCGDRMSILSGDDALTLPILSVGGRGVISVVANIVPREVTRLVHAFLEGDLGKARDQHYSLLSLVRSLFLETNPIPVKTALALMQKIKPDLRLPLIPLKAENLTKLKAELKRHALI